MAASLRTCLEIPETYISYVFGESVELDQSVSDEEEKSEQNIVKRSINTFGWEWKGNVFFFPT